LQRDGYRRWLRRDRRVTAPDEVLASELRRRSGSLFASVGMHRATNAIGVLFGVVAWRLAA
jgi:hypothetical protein